MSPPYALLVVGGGPAGLAGARAFRDAGGRGPVAIVTDEGRVPYNRPPLTKELLRGDMAEVELPLESEAWLAEHAVDLVDGRAVALDPHGRTLTLSGGRTLDYAQCLLATGAEPTRPPIPGADDPGVRVIRTLDHLRELLTRLTDHAPVGVVGSGFIGCEIAASLALRGHPVTLVSGESAPNVARLGEDAAGRIAGWLRGLGVTLQLGAEVNRVTRDDDQLAVHAGDGAFPAGLVVMAVGVAPRSELLVPAGIDLPGGAVPADTAMRTALDGILVAGDVAFAENRAAGRALRVDHWGDALGQGAVAGATAAGSADAWDAVPGFWSAIGQATLKYAAWGDGHDEIRFAPADDGDGFVVRYGRAGRLVGVLTHEDDDAYASGRELIAAGAPFGQAG